MDDILRSYIEDLRDNLLSLSEALMLLDQGIVNEETINKIFRVAHTIKGNSLAMEYMNAGKVMHEMEDILQEVRGNEKELTPEIINLLYVGHDFLENLMNVLASDGNDDNLEIQSILTQIAAVKSGNTIEDENNSPINEKQKNLADEALFIIPDFLLELLGANIKRGLFAYQVKVKLPKGKRIKVTKALNVLKIFEENAMLLYSDPEKPSESKVSKITFEQDSLNALLMSESDIENLEKELLEDDKINDVTVLQITEDHLLALSENPQIAQQALKTPSITKTKKTPAKPKKGKDDGGAAKAVNKKEKVSPVKPATPPKKQAQTNDKSTQHADAGSQIRVPVTKVDNLMDMIGELIILNSQLEQQIDSLENVDTVIQNSISRASKIMRSVQDLSTSLRLIHIKDTLFRLVKVVRDTSTELNKKAKISIIGEDTEIDRSAAEKLFDPLMHIVRNAVSHGIELPDERIKRGKKPEGMVQIKAYSKRSNVFLVK
jgi:two-component system, chemotaxis family, sensor kinase CheA